MIVECPSCGVRGSYNKEKADVLHCNRCGTTFSLSEAELPDHGLSARVWRVKGEKGPPVSLRVLRYRLKTGSLLPEKLISSDGEEWTPVFSHPMIVNATGEFQAPSQNQDEPPFHLHIPSDERAHPPTIDEVTVEAASATPEPVSPGTEIPPEFLETVPPVTKKSTGKRGKRVKKALVGFGFASFAVVASAAFFFPLSESLENLKMENGRLTQRNVNLKKELTGAKSKIGEMEKRLTELDTEFERVRSSSEEFLKAKTILEDIKASIDSHKIYLVISLAENRLYVKIGTKTVKRYTVSTGKGRTILKSTGKPYNFLTPRGKMVIEKKERNPVWFKPDWAWLETGAPLPVNLSIQERVVKGALGKYRLKMGRGYAIHGTESGNINGKKETHGCIRVARKDLKALYKMVKSGTEVYIY